MRQQPPQPAQPPQPPFPPEPPPGSGFGVFGSRRLSEEEIESLRGVRAEYSNQLTNILDRRGELVQQLQRAEGIEREGLVAQINVMSSRIVRLEGELERTSKELTDGMFQAGSLVAPQSPFDRLPPENVTA